MAANTKIEWCDHTFSPWEGCSKVSPGCAHCYAATYARRFGIKWGPGTPRPMTKSWDLPRRWNRKAERAYVAAAHSTPPGQPIRLRRPTVFPSRMDWLDEDVPAETLAAFLGLVTETPYLNWLLLTKRPENFLSLLRLAAGELGVAGERGDKGASDAWGMVFDWIKGTPPANVWVGTSVEDQIRADERIPHLLRIPAVGRFLSVEPLLGPVDLQMMRSGGELGEGEPWMDCLRGRVFDSQGDGTNTESIHWVIIGGESGPGSRSCNVAWIRSLVIQCLTAGVPGFVKQLGARPYRVEHQPDGDEAVDISLRHPKGGDPTEWPAEVRYVREFPEGLR